MPESKKTRGGTATFLPEEIKVAICDENSGEKCQHIATCDDKVIHLRMDDGEGTILTLQFVKRNENGEPVRGPFGLIEFEEHSYLVKSMDVTVCDV